MTDPQSLTLCTMSGPRFRWSRKLLFISFPPHSCPWKRAQLVASKKAVFQRYNWLRFTFASVARISRRHAPSIARPNAVKPTSLPH